MNWELWQWGVVAVAALLVGVSKTGIAGLGVLFVAIFTCVLPAKLASGFVLPLLIFGDLVAVWSYRGHAQWRHLWRLFPWTAAGVAVGYLAMGRIDDRQAQVLVGSIICAMVALHLGRKWQVARRPCLQQAHQRRGHEIVVVGDVEADHALATQQWPELRR